MHRRPFKGRHLDSLEQIAIFIKIVGSLVLTEMKHRTAASKKIMELSIFSVNAIAPS